MLSPNTSATLSSPINSSPIINASASPLGCSCIAYENFIPSCSPVPNNSLNTGKSLGVEIINTSLIPANISVDNG